MGGASAFDALGGDRPVRVLLVDDDEDYARYLRRLLGKLHPVQLDIVHDLNTARHALETGRYALVISDYDLKPGTGLQLLSHARDRQDRGLRILISGNTSQVPIEASDAAHYVWDKSWEIELLKGFAEAALRTASRIPTGEMVRKPELEQ